MSLANSQIKISNLNLAAHNPFLLGAYDGIFIRNLPAYMNSREKTLRGLQSLDVSGEISINLQCYSPELLILDGGGPDAIALCRAKPAFCNICAYEEEWITHPEYNDFMRPDSPVHLRKSFQARIYEELISKFITDIDFRLNNILDAGAGAGRMARFLASTGAIVHFADASAKALKTAWRELCLAGASKYDLHRIDVSSLDIFENDSFDFVLSLETLCYLHDPAEAAAGLARVCRPGGFVSFSVENKTGAILGDSNLTIEDIASLADSDTLHIPDYCYTRYYTRESAAALATDAGLELISVTGCHYTADGPFDRLVSEEALSGPSAFGRFLHAECVCREIPDIEKTARAWFVVAKKP